MHIILDHLAAVLISSVVLLIFVLIQLRGTQTTTEATVNHIVYTEATDVSKNLIRDIENMLTSGQTSAAMNDGRLLGSTGVFTCQITTVASPVGPLTTSFTFPTVANADSSFSAGSDPLTAQAVQVVYNLVATGDSIDITIANLPQRVPMHQLQRVVAGVVTGASKGFMTQFIVETARKDVAGYARTIGTAPCPVSMTNMRFEYKLATGGVEFITSDQRSTNQHNISRFGITVSLSNWANASP